MLIYSLIFLISTGVFFYDIHVFDRELINDTVVYLKTGFSKIYDRVQFGNVETINKLQQMCSKFTCFIVSKVRYKHFCIGFVILLILISGTRLDLGGTDYGLYEMVYNTSPNLIDFFKNFTNLDQIYVNFGWERGFLFIYSFFKTLGLSFYSFTLLHSLFFYSIFFKSISRYSGKYGLIFLLFLYKIFFYNTFISLRQSITIAIFIYMWRYIEAKEFKKYLLGCFICITVHTASVILIPIYFINNIDLNKIMLKNMVIATLPFLFLSFFNIKFDLLLEPFIALVSNQTIVLKISNAIQSMVSGEGISILHTIEYFIIFYFVYKSFDDLYYNDKKYSVVLKMFILLLPIFTVFRGIAVFTRFKDYFIIVYALIISKLINKSKYSVVIAIIIVLWCAFGFFRFILLFDNGHLLPYTSYLELILNIFFN